MPGIFLTTNVFAHVGGLFFPLSFTRKKAWQKGCVWFDSYGLPPLTGASPPYPRSLQAFVCFAGVLGKQSASGCLQTKRANHSLNAYGCEHREGASAQDRM